MEKNRYPVPPVVGPLPQAPNVNPQAQPLQDLGALDGLFPIFCIRSVNAIHGNPSNEQIWQEYQRFLDALKLRTELGPLDGGAAVAADAFFAQCTTRLHTVLCRRIGIAGMNELTATVNNLRQYLVQLGNLVMHTTALTHTMCKIAI